MKRAVFAALTLVAAGTAASAQDSDLDRIPSAAFQNAPPESAPAAPAHGKYFLENDFAWSFEHGALAVPYPEPIPSRWSDRLSFDGVDQWALSGNLTASYSDRFILSEADGVEFPSQSVRNDLREAYLTWEPVTQTYVEVGRINLRNGVALGFNPTDFFRDRTAVSQASLDPSALREDRLGAAMVRIQTIWDGGSLSVVYAPKLEAPSPLFTGSGFTPDFDHTNAADRVMLSANFEFADLSPQLLVYNASGHTKFGLDLSYPIGQSIIAYGEWSGGRAPDMVVDAIQFGERTGMLPPAAPIYLPTDPGRKFQNDLAVGASWTSAAKFTVNLEYHFHEAGFSKQDWRDWFAVGAGGSQEASELWFLRGYASDQQIPMSQQQIFLRIDAPETIARHLDVSGFVLADPYDGSMLTQLAAFYDLSDSWSAGGYVSANLGGKRSEWGSLPGAGSVIFEVQRFF
jgi:opacity protein-like surface antigen